MTNKEFVAIIEKIYNCKTVYLHGAFGAPLTDKTKARYCATDSINIKNKTRIYACTPDYFGFDCIGMIKGVLWGFSFDSDATYGGAVYKVNTVPDVSADGMITLCKDVTKDFTNIPVGAYVYMRGHCGIYVGDGYVIECTPKWNGGVQKTVCVNHPCNATGNARKWVSWGKIPFIEYEEEDNSDVKPLQAIINGRFVTIENSINISGNNFVKLRDIGDLLGYKVSYDKAHKMPRLDSKV